MKYKNYEGTIEYNNVYNIYQGRILNINEIIIYCAFSKYDLYNEFKEMVNYYLEYEK